MTKKLKWRLSKLPTAEELRGLVNDKILTQDEAREILFTQEEETERDKESLESEIKFLRELVEKLSKNRTEIVETIRYVQPIYETYPWYKPYQVWCSSSGTNIVSANYQVGDTSSTGGLTDGVQANLQSGQTGFSTIQTF
jgi:hypothetical protein